MLPTMRLHLLLPLLLVLGACSNLDQRQYEQCVLGWTVVGGAAGGTASGGSGIVPAAAAGAAVSSIWCEEADSALMGASTASTSSVRDNDGDSDGDGIINSVDRCPGTPAGAEVDDNGCALDSDGDGVPDYKDQCRGTPANVRVDDVGCPVKDEVVLTVDRLAFDFDSAQLDAKSKAALDQVVSVIKSHAAVDLDVIGYTDSSGPEDYNQKLSERRAAAAVKYLVSQGVSSSQLTSSGRGEANPVASNATRDGREQNRRVELVVK